MQLLVNNVPVTPGAIATDMTLLRYLRGNLQLTGTKEGCASGDCGACTVLLGAAGPEGVVYRAVNSCICPLGSLNNQHVLTVEGLGKGQLHPVQEAMVSYHASQCGFCTPGFVMSLTALYLSAKDVSAIAIADQRKAVVDAISGNLCRCTGYQPIIDAGIAVLNPAANNLPVKHWLPDLSPVERPAAQALQAAANPVQIADQAAIYPVLTEGSHQYWQPTTEAELQSLLVDYPDARLLAGGTDLMLEVTQSYKCLPVVIDLNRIASLTRITLNEELLEIGAAATYTELERVLADISPESMHLLSRLGSRQIRNRGTLGGNICNASPVADMPPLLLVLDAELVIGNSAGHYRRELLGDFYRAYKHTTLATGEYLAKVLIERSALSRPLKLYKITKRYEDDIAAVMSAFWWDGQQELKIAFGGMAAIPRRATLTESFIRQQQWLYQGQVDPQILAQAAAILRREFSPLSDVRASADYRMAMACNLLTKACYAFAAHAAGDSFVDGVFDHA